MFVQVIKGHTSDPTGLRQQMEIWRRDLKPGAVVMITDCCSTPVKLPFKNRRVWSATRPAALSPVFRDLFFRTRGTASITAATGNASWGDDDNGGIFTRSLCDMLRKKHREMDTNRDGFLSWREFFPLIPRWLTPHDPAVIAQFHKGQATLYRLAVLRDWAVPVAAWTTFLLLLFMTSLSLNALLRARWASSNR